ncbi:MULTISPECIES: fumarylacetoacetate hydrolase family protein [Rhodomicrobium]|uniref:fumarylacetoacetate hydrolase family protein n=1 Tax=Rhodomicrobium TaxID=1068 RepID=UPI000B4ADD37|nr:MULTISPECIES: fumarylacetoacetate hydrolase family protein [Rhodomicrobium]
METSRRDLLKMGAAVAATGLAATAKSDAVIAQTASAQAATVPADNRLRLVSYAAIGSDSPKLGVVPANGTVIDVAKAAQAAGQTLTYDPTSMVAFIEAGPAAVDQLRAIVAKAGEGVPLKDVALLPPIPKLSRNIYAVGWNYLEHFEEGKEMRDPNQKIPEHPVFFTKGVHVLNSPFGPIPYDPAVSTLIDWECELAVIIGKKGRNISEADAMSHVFGFTVINDTTARDVQTTKHGGQWFKGKSLDGHGPMGPWVIPASDLDPSNLKLQLRVNGVIKQDASTKQMYFKIPRIIAELSSGLTLEAGDIIATGTPPGVGHARKPPEYLKPGDVMETEIAEIGTLRNVIQALA